MSVFTPVSIKQLQDWLKNYDIGELLQLNGISSGITNTNYFVSTSNSKFILTLFEHNNLEELPFFIDLMKYLAEQDIPCPLPIQDKFGVSLHELNGKPAVLVSCLNGQDVKLPNHNHCAKVGAALAKMHLAGQFFMQKYPQYKCNNQRGPDWCSKIGAQVIPYLSDLDKNLLAETLAFQSLMDVSNLPMGITHADLFRDNVLFDGDEIGGLIDFYYSCHDVLAYDLAIAVNDWCTNADGSYDRLRLEAMLHAYEEIRELNHAENAAWNGLLRIAALRFWLSRLCDYFFPQAGELTHSKDPDHFQRILRLRSNA